MIVVIRAFLFDLGGTLYHFHGASEKDLFILGARCSYDLLRVRGALDCSFDEFLREIRRVFLPALIRSTITGREMRPEEIYPRVASRLGIESPVDGWDDLERAWHAPVRERLGLIDGGKELLDALRSRGVRLGVISNIIFRAELAMEQLEMVGIRDRFETFTFSSEIGYRKPHRRIYLDALRKIGVPPRQVGYVGNRVREDVRGPERLGMRAILYAPAPPRLPLPRPRRRARSLHEVREIALRWCRG